MTSPVVERTRTDPLITGWADPDIGLGLPRPSTPPPVAAAVRRITVVLTEVLIGARPLTQITRWISPAEQAALGRWRAHHPRVTISRVRAHTRHPHPAQVLVQISWESSVGQLSAVVDLVVDDAVHCRRVLLLVD